MRLRDAHRLLRDAELSSRRSIALISSFEPLHLKTLLQAELVQRARTEVPRVVTFDYDSLAYALAETSTTLAAAPALLVLTWEDLHPALSWRTRADFSAVSPDELANSAARLFDRLRQWVSARGGSETYVAAPPMEWMPWLDPEPTRALGPIRARAVALLAQAIVDFQGIGARVLPIPAVELSLRDLLLAGSPLSADGAARLAEAFADAAMPAAERKKVVVLDADETLWSGVLGEVGVDGVECGPDGQGWPYYAFQKFLLKLKRDGTILALSSKNDLDEVRRVFATRELPLAWEDFAAHRVSWDSKADGLRSLAEELNLGLDAFVFVDDNGAEIALIEHELPSVTTLVAPKDAAGWDRVFSALQDLCATWQVTSDDRTRTDMLRLHRSRPTVERSAHGTATWAHLRDLGLQVAFNNDGFDDPRSLQLVNKTNQFNLTGERIPSEDWISLREAEDSFCCSTRLSDRFGDFGTIAVAVGQRETEAELRLRQFVVSCRAFGRGVEHLTLLHLLQLFDADLIRIAYRDSGRNEPARRFLAQFGSADAATAGFAVLRETLETAVDQLLQEARPVIAR